MAKSISASARRTEIPGQLDPLSVSSTCAVLRCRFFVDSSLSIFPLGSSIFLTSLHVSIFLRFYHNHSVRGLEIARIFSSHSPDVANEVVLGNQTPDNQPCTWRHLIHIDLRHEIQPRLPTTSPFTNVYVTDRPGSIVRGLPMKLNI